MVPVLEPEKVQKYPTMPEVVEELKRVTNIGFPILTMSLVNYLRNMVMVVCMGKLGSLELAGGALAIGFTNITGYSVLSGLAMGMDPICSQAFGSQNDVVAFLTLQRTIFILLFASLPISLLWFNLEPLMLILNQNPDITKIASLYCKFAIPDLLANTLLHPLQWWWYEFMTLLAGYLPNPKVPLATSAIVIQTTSLMYTLPSALSASASTRVGNELGAGRPAKARLAAAVAVVLALVTSLLGLVGTTFGKGPWGRVFTDDKEILELTLAVLPIIGLCELANCPQTTSCGILRGSARPGIGAAINFYAFYLVGAPVAVVLSFVCRLGFLGLSYGLLAAQIACVVSILAVVYNTDWEKESVKAKDLVAIKVNYDHDHDGHQNQITVLLQ
ncbi:Multi antimicrobial extrusion protein [Trema orientale]|uniref:Multi antimicrobial extrusion protein n=1 Tax=Trema orientale TaxID=63057 RepID=A0A2P5ES51_TREOI|nr:Multi antimicrobial extrusion protein [Trema orientale]